MSAARGEGGESCHADMLREKNLSVTKGDRERKRGLGMSAHDITAESTQTTEAPDKPKGRCGVARDRRRLWVSCPGSAAVPQRHSSGAMSVSAPSGRHGRRSRSRFANVRDNPRGNTELV